MIHSVKLVDLGDEGAFLPIPKDFLERMNATVGDQLVAEKTHDGFTLTLSSAARER